MSIHNLENNTFLWEIWDFRSVLRNNFRLLKTLDFPFSLRKVVKPRSFLIPLLPPPPLNLLGTGGSELTGTSRYRRVQKNKIEARIGISFHWEIGVLRIKPNTIEQQG